jgi:hypothetical protein
LTIVSCIESIFVSLQHLGLQRRHESSELFALVDDLENRIAHDDVLVADARRLGQLDLPASSFLCTMIAPVPSQVRTFMVCPRLPTNTNSALLLGSARIRSRTSPPRRS